MVNLLDFINSISKTDDIHFSTRAVGGKLDLLAPGDRPTALTLQLATGLTSQS